MMKTLEQTKQKPYKVIDLEDYVDKELFTFDYGDFWFDTEGLKSLSELKNHYFPDTKFPKSFNEEDKLKCINAAYRDAEEQSYMSDYIAKFHERLLDNLNDNEDFENKVTFEYEEDCWDSIKLRVYYGIEFLTDEDNILEDWLGNDCDFKSIVESTRKRMENYDASDSKCFDEVYKDRIKDSIWEVKREKLTTYQQVAKLMKSHMSNRKKIYNIIKIVQNGR